MVVDFKALKNQYCVGANAPPMVLKTLHDEIIGVVGSCYDRQLDLKFIEESKISFKVPAYEDGERTALYDELHAMRKIDLSPLGEYILDEPKTEGDGLQEYKVITGSSAEVLFANRNMILEAGTYRFYSADDFESSNPATIMGVVHKLIPEWTITVDESLWSKYRTFDDTKEGVLDWLRTKAAKSFGCIFNFDSSTKHLYVLDASKEYDLMPIYLSFDNLIKKGVRTEYTKEFCTVLNVYGADPVNIREVNPIGTNKIYNVDYFIENGDIPDTLASKWMAWNTEISLAQERYTMLQLVRNSAIMQKENADANMRDLEGELQSIESLIDAKIAAIAINDDPEIESRLQAEYQALLTDRESKQNEVIDLQQEISGIDSEIASHNEELSAIRNRLAFDRYFNANEMAILQSYFLESDFVDETFAEFDVDVSSSQDRFVHAQECRMTVQGVSDDVVPLDLSEVDPDGIINKQIIRLNGGALTLTAGGSEIQAIIISGTIERDIGTGDTVCSIYTGKGNLNQSGAVLEFGNANISIVGNTSSNQFASDSISNALFTDCKLYFTKNTTAFESYAVQKALYDYAVEQHRTIAFPLCSFDISSGNVLYAEEFEPFKDALALGKGLYLDFSDGTVLTPLLLEIHFSLDDPGKFDLVFSNTYSRHDSVKTMKDLIEDSKKSARTLDMAKYNYGAYNRTGADSEVRTLFLQGISAAASQILAGTNNCVKINGAGITISGSTDPSSYLRMNNGMIAFMDDQNEARLAIGKFYDTGIGQVMYGVVAPNVVGTLLAGENLVIQSPKFDGTHMFFSVDGMGAKLANGQFDIYKGTTAGGITTWGKAISLDPELGILGGALDDAISYNNNGAVNGVRIKNGNTVIGTVKSIAAAKAGYSNFIQHLTPNFWVDLNGDAFFRGTVYANSGQFSGDVIASGFYTLDQNGNPVTALVKEPGQPDKISSGIVQGVPELQQSVSTISTDLAGISLETKTKNNKAYITLKNGAGSDSDVELSLGVSNGATSSTITMKAGGITVASQEIKFTGVVTFSDLKDAGKTTEIRGDYITTGTINADNVVIANNYGGVGVGTGLIGSTPTYGPILFADDNPTNPSATRTTKNNATHYVIATNAGARMASAGSAIYCSDNIAVMTAGGSLQEVHINGLYIKLNANTVLLQDDSPVVSDRNRKNNISYDMDKYSDFFMTLKPAFYKLNHGSSNRFHVGYIYQDVESALESTGLSSNDFAGIVKTLGTNLDTGLREEECALRYSEFISLNTYMIQKLYARIEELENQISILSGGNE